MRFEADYILEYLNDILVEVVPECRKMTINDLVDYLLCYHEDDSIQACMESHFIEMLQGSFTSDICTVLRGKIRLAVKMIFPSSDFELMEYNKYAIYLYGGYYDDKK